MRSRKDLTLIFLHIPKTGGSTLRNLIKRNYKGQPIFSIDGRRARKSIEAFKKLPEAQRKSFKVLQRHMLFGLHEFLSSPSTYITMLRDPIERIISHYYYVLRDPEHYPYLYKKVKSQNMSLNISLKDYVISGISTELDNGQTRLLSGMKNVDFGCCPREMLEIAKKNLREHFAVIGLMERSTRPCFY